MGHNTRAAGMRLFSRLKESERRLRRYRSSEQSLRGEGGAVAKRAQLLPYQFFGDVTHAGGRFEAAVRPRHDAMRVADDACSALDSIRDDLRMFDIVGGRVDDTSDERHPGGKRMALEASILVLVTRIRHREQQRADARGVEMGQDVVERDIAVMRSLVVAPAYVEPRAIGWNVCERAVRRCNHQVDKIEEVLERALRV